MKKKGLYCQHCNNSVTIYRKGKHKLYFCSNCGVIAYNPTLKQTLGHGIFAGIEALPGGAFVTRTTEKQKRAGLTAIEASGVPILSQVAGLAPAERSLSPTMGGQRGFSVRRNSSDTLIRLIQAEKMIGR